MENTLLDSLDSESELQRLFPVRKHRIFLAHAGVTALPSAAVEAIKECVEAGSQDNQENVAVWSRVQDARNTAASFLGCDAAEVALLGPTALGLNLVANGLDWQEGDEVVYYRDDYPANVYPWTKLSAKGVTPVSVQPRQPGEITWECVEAVLTERTRLVALASCHFLSGYRIDISGIGKGLQERGILFCLDAIQSLGCGPLDLTNVDFASADSHKWMLGPVGAGVFYVRRDRQEELASTLLGAWNVMSPEFIAQDEIRLEAGARRYEPGTMNIPGIFGMKAALELLMQVGHEETARRIAMLVDYTAEGMRDLGFSRYGPVDRPETSRSGIASFSAPDGKDPAQIFQALENSGINVSLRQNRDGEPLLRVSPHLYNTRSDLDSMFEVIRDAG